MPDVDDERFREDAERDAARTEALFKAVADAYGFVHSWETLRSTSGTTIGDLLRARVAEIRGPHPQGLPSELEAIDQVKSAFDSAIAQLRQQETDSGTEGT